MSFGNTCKVSIFLRLMFTCTNYSVVFFFFNCSYNISQNTIGGNVSKCTHEALAHYTSCSRCRKQGLGRGVMSDGWMESVNEGQNHRRYSQSKLIKSLLQRKEHCSLWCLYSSSAPQPELYYNIKSSNKFLCKRQKKINNSEAMLHSFH